MVRHIIILSVVAWGHMRPECNLAVNLARRFPDLTVSFIADADFQSNAQNEVNRIVGKDEKELLARIRVIAAGRALAGITLQLAAANRSMDPRASRWPSPVCTQAIQNILESIMEGEAFEDDSGTKWEGIAQKPSLVISDAFMADAALPLKEKYQLPTHLFLPAIAASPFTRMFGPLAAGGQAEGYVEECDAIEADPARAKGRGFAEIAKQTWAHSGRYPDDIVRVMGLKPSYEWEDFPQEHWMPAAYWVIAGSYPLVQKADGLLLPTSLQLDKEGTEGVKEWFSRPVFSLGPQLPPSYLDSHISVDSNGSSGTEFKISYANAKVDDTTGLDPSIAFLDEAFGKHGAGSVLYISFGSAMVPKDTHIGYLFDVLLELDEPFPFLFAAASPALQLPDGLAEKVAASGRGLIVPWAPQQQVFQHRATGWALSHCGAGGLSEALAQGMPLIAWPIAADQPQNARWVTEVLDAAFELLQVRTGLGQKKAFRGGPNGTDIIGTEEAIKAEMRDVLKRARGEEGKRKMANASKVRQIIHDSQMPGGQVDQHYELLGKLIV
ncbi:glycosyltransferase family 1 protein [Calocera viscosa TUFC12733]|uniref:Glycosyltransferase family 1 protein n=1 Tax=Calocera viscosa (strain TUFC12733) TaxID=1330018 RepID=A0A167PP03_CALVF|nr:glycosyltransferase family 1 protein [Calocera viscosa TUFC12733]